MTKIMKVTLQMKVTFPFIRVQNLILVFKTYIGTLPQRNITQHPPQLSEPVNFSCMFGKEIKRKQ